MFYVFAYVYIFNLKILLLKNDNKIDKNVNR